ncbi:ATP-binding protein [Morganella morganii]|uniref:ATP-binding protein n=1 Tax=Morganella morganii TaxID=582 RepID=UPI000FA34714|nr:ATP-binding protein [Morganella morganii]MBT0412194.1 ATP-binding protein [Morganella morganii subsp. morganii]MBV0430869.1 ATP-binding protein [Morganella morganii subsp. morganii]HCT2376084.1 ATP-binding protein [Morganella morganii]
MIPFQQMKFRMDALTAEKMGEVIYLNDQPVCAVEFHFLPEMGPVSGDGVSYVIFTPGVTVRRNDRVVISNAEYTVTRALRYNGKPHIFIESE